LGGFTCTLSILPADPVIMSVQVKPPNVPVSWMAHRDTRPAPKGDNPLIKSSLSPAPRDTPTLTQVAGHPLSARLLCDSVGSFHVCAYVDCNGNNLHDFNDAKSGARIDREPFIPMKLVLVRVKGNANKSIAHSNAGFGPSAGPRPAANTPFTPTSVTGLRMVSGNFNAPATAAVHNLATVDVIGGGRNGKLGLSELFGGWVNNESTVEDVVSTYLDPATGNVHTHSSVQVANPNTFVPGAGGGVPMILAPPFLDVSPFGNEGTGGNTCVGTESPAAPGPPPPPASGILKVDAPTATNPLRVGQQWTIKMFDSPGDNCPPTHAALPGRLTTYRFNLNFRTDLVFWTNIQQVAGPTVDPECHLYASVQTNHWTIRYSIAFNAAGNAPRQTAASLRVHVEKDKKPQRLATPVQGSGLEVRFPFLLNVLGIDARN
jgi:hypothetical protein